MQVIQGYHPQDAENEDSESSSENDDSDDGKEAANSPHDFAGNSGGGMEEKQTSSAMNRGDSRPTLRILGDRLRFDFQTFWICVRRLFWRL